MTSVPTIKLNDGTSIPQLGFGTYQIDPAETREAVRTALDVGYRHIDTAEMYENEEGVGEAIREANLDRSSLFVTSKLNNGFHDPDKAMKAFDETLQKLDIGYLDLFLIHWPMPDTLDYVDTWRAMEKMLASGNVRSIGVSNFQTHHLQKLLDETDTKPVVNQIEVHPYFQNNEVREFCAGHDIAVEAWSPIAQGEVIDDDALVEIGEAHGKSAAQATLRWHLQRGDVIFPKSTHEERMKENFDIFDFELTEDEMETINGLDRNERRGPNPDEFNYIP